MEEEWEELWNEKHQRKYWKNKATGEKTWKDPKKMSSAASVSSKPDEGQAPQGQTEANNTEWEELWNEKHQRKYWKNKQTGEKTWSRPADVAAEAKTQPPPPPDQSVVEQENTESKPTEVVQAVESDWVEAFNEKHQRKYWKNTKTGEKSWHPPPAANKESSEAKAGGPEALNDEWVEMFNEKHQRKYWKNKVTGKSSWTNPNEHKEGKASEPASKAASFISVVSVLTDTTSADVWEELFSEKHKRKYWKNKITGKSQWTKPEATAPAAEEKPSAPEQKEAPAESEWIELFSEKHKRKYWKNKVTGKQSWTPPPPPPAPAAAAPPAITKEVVVPIKEEEKPLPQEPQKILAYRTLTRIANEQENADSLFLFELIGPLANLEIVVHRVINEELFLENSDSLLPLESSLRLDGGLEEFKRFHAQQIVKVSGNKEIGSLDFIISPNAPHQQREGATEETKQNSAEVFQSQQSSSTEQQRISFFLHSAIVVQQVIYIFQNYQTSFQQQQLPQQTQVHSFQIEDFTKDHRLLMDSKISEIFINATYLISVPEKYLVLEKQIAFYNCVNYKKVFLSENLKPTTPAGTVVAAQQSASQVTQPHQHPSITSVNTQPIGQKEVEILESNLFPIAGMVVIKAQLTLSSPESFIEGNQGANNNNNTNSNQLNLGSLNSQKQQVKTGAWMPCWIHIDIQTKTIAFYERGPAQPPTFKISCQQAILNVNDLIEVDDELEISLLNAHLLLGGQDHESPDNNNNQQQQQQIEIMNIYFLFKNIEDLWRWTLSFSSLCPVFQWKNNENIQMTKIPKYHFYSSSASDNISSELQLRSILSDGNVFYQLENMIVDREIVRNFIRYISLPGYLIQFIKFMQLNAKIIIHSKSFQFHSLSYKDVHAIQSLTEGSLLLSINGLSAVQLPSATVLKFISEIPKEMSTDMAFIKFSNGEFIVNAVEIDHTGIVPVFSSAVRAGLSPTGVTNSHHHENNVTKKLDNESKNQLNKVLEKKRSRMNDFHDDNDSAASGSHRVNENHHNNSQKMTLNQFHLTNFNQIPWNSFRLLIQNGKILLIPLNPAAAAGGNAMEMNFRFSFNQLQQCKILIHNNKDTNLLNNLNELCIELFDHRYHLILNCSNFRLYRSLLRSLLLGMKLSGSIPLDLPYIYTQSEKFKMQQNRHNLVNSLGAGESNSDSNLAMNQAQLQDEIHNEQLRKTLNKFSTSGLLQQAMLLANPGNSADEGVDSDHEETHAPHHHHQQHESEKHKGHAPVRRESVIMSLSSVLDDYNEEFRSRSLLQAAEALEETLTSLELPLTFPTPTVIDQNLQELRSMNRANHQLLAELMTLQVEAMNPPEQAPAQAPAAPPPPPPPKTSYPNYAEAISQATNNTDDYGSEYDRTEDNETESVVENVQNIDEHLFPGGNEPPQAPVMTSSPPPPPPPDGKPRRSSFITGNPIDLSQQSKPTGAKLTRRASRLSVSIDLSNMNPMQNIATPGPMSTHSQPNNSSLLGAVKPGGPKLNLTSDDLLALKVLFLHLRENPSDLISATSKISSQQDLAIFSYILVHRIYGQFSNDLLNLCDLFDVAIRYENTTSIAATAINPNLIAPSSSSAAGSNKVYNNYNPIYQTSFPDKVNHPGNFLDEFTTAATLISSSIRTPNSNNNANSFQNNYQHLYFNEFVQYFSYSVRPITQSSSSSNSPSPLKGFAYSTNAAGARSLIPQAHSTNMAASNHATSSSIQSNSLLLLVLYEISHRVDVMSFFEVLCVDLMLQHIHFPYLASASSHSQNNYAHHGMNQGGNQQHSPLNFMIPINEICQHIVDPIANKLEVLIQEGLVPKLLLLMMKKLSNHYVHENYHKEYFLSILIPFILHKILIYCKVHAAAAAAASAGMDDNSLGSSGGYNNSPGMGSNNTAASEEQLVYMIQYIKQILLLCFNASPSSSATSAGSSSVSSAAGNNNNPVSSAGMIGLGNNTILINQKIITLSLSDIAILSKSKWSLTRSFDHLVHQIEDLNRQNIHNYSISSIHTQGSHHSSSINPLATSLSAATQQQSNGNGGMKTSHVQTARSPLATLSLLHSYTGKSKILDSYLCLRPSELLFLLQLFDLYNLTSSSLMISSSRQLSQAITILQTSDIVGKLSLFIVPGSATSAGVSGSGGGGQQQLSSSSSGGRKSYQKLTIDREMTITIEVDPSILNYKQLESFNNGRNSANTASNLPSVLQNKSWSELFSSSNATNTGSNINPLLASLSLDHSVNPMSGNPIHSSNNNNNSNGNDFIGEDFLSANNPLADLTNSDYLLNNNMYQENNELNSIQWLINTARITLKYIYENISNISLQKSKSIIKELSDINLKLQTKRKIIQDILFDYSKLLINKDLLFNYKMILQFLFDLLQMNQSINLQVIRSTGNNNNKSLAQPNAKRGSVGSVPYSQLQIPGIGALPSTSSSAAPVNPMNNLLSPGMMMMNNNNNNINNNPLLSVTSSSSASSQYLDIYHFPLQFDLLKVLSFHCFQDYYAQRFHFYSDEEKEFMINSLVYKGIYYEKQLTMLFLQQQTFHFQHQQALVANAVDASPVIGGHGHGHGQLSQKIQQQKLVFVSSSALNQSTNPSMMMMAGESDPMASSPAAGSAAANNLVLPTTGGMNPLRVIMQNVFQSSSSSSVNSSSAMVNPSTPGQQHSAVSAGHAQHAHAQPVLLGPSIAQASPSTHPYLLSASSRRAAAAAMASSTSQQF